MNNFSSTKYGRFTILRDENKSFLYSTTEALLKSGTHEDCVKYADELDNMREV